MKSYYKLLLLLFPFIFILWYTYDSNSASELKIEPKTASVLQLKLTSDVWLETKNGWCYQFADGTFANRWLHLDGKQYFFDSEGFRVTGWHIIDLKHYYFDEDGVLQKNKWIDGKYVDNNGVMLKNTITPDYKYVGPDGIVDETYAGWDASWEGLDGLKTKLSEMLNNYNGTWSMYVKNIDTNEYLVINNEPIYSASLIKLFCMMTIYEKLENKKIVTDDLLEHRMDQMITVSSNDTFNELVIFLGDNSHMTGREIINEYCTRNYYTDTILTSTLQPSYVKAPASAGRNTTTVMDCGMALEKIYRGSCVNKQASHEMLDLLLNQQILVKIPAGLPKGTTSASKTGETSEVQHDAAIVYSEGATYIICIMSSRCGLAPVYIRNLSTVVYDYFNPNPSLQYKTLHQPQYQIQYKSD